MKLLKNSLLCLLSLSTLFSSAFAEKFDIKQKKEYMEKYLGSEESNSSDNLIKYLEENKKVFI